MNHFTPWSSTLGGMLIGASASLLLLLNGRVAGISGIVGGLVWPRRGEVSWRAVFLLGLLAGGLLLRLLRPASFGVSPITPVTMGTSSSASALVVIAGLLVGFGTRLGGGCTSGHGVCGLSRGSPRSLAATCTFMATGIAAAVLVRHVLAAGVNP